MKKILFFLLLILFSCSNDETQISEPVVDDLYFPAIDSDQWETINHEELNWDSVGIEIFIIFFNLTTPVLL